jgi:hypothetical protein
MPPDADLEEEEDMRIPIPPPEQRGQPETDAVDFIRRRNWAVFAEGTGQEQVDRAKRACVRVGDFLGEDDECAIEAMYRIHAVERANRLIAAALGAPGDAQNALENAENNGSDVRIVNLSTASDERYAIKRLREVQMRMMQASLMHIGKYAYRPSVDVHGVRTFAVEEVLDPYEPTKHMSVIEYMMRMGINEVETRFHLWKILRKGQMENWCESLCMADTVNLPHVVRTQGTYSCINAAGEFTGLLDCRKTLTVQIAVPRIPRQDGDEGKYALDLEDYPLIELVPYIPGVSTTYSTLRGAVFERVPDSVALEPPPLLKILHDQNITGFGQTLFMGMIGRCLVKRIDPWHVGVYICGKSGTGKSSAMYSLVAVIPLSERASITTNGRDMFGLGDAMCKQLMMFPDIQNPYALSEVLGPVLSVMSGEDVQQRTMNTMPYSMRSKTEVWMASNFMPNFRNIMAWLRRLLVFEFRTPILTHDGGIKERIDRTSVQLAHMCVWEYRRLVDAFPDTDLHDHLPPEMCASLKRAQERSDTFMQFITSDHVRVGNGIECETQALQRCYLDFCKSRAIHALRTWEDLLPIFLQLDAQDRPILQGATAEIATTLTINIVGAKVTGIAPNDNPYH